MGYAPGTNFSKRLEPDIRKAMTLAEGAIQLSSKFKGKFFIKLLHFIIVTNH